MFLTRQEQATIGVCAVLLLGCAGVWVWKARQPPAPAAESSPLVRHATSPTDEAPLLTIHVAGRVKHPGVYHLRVQQRVHEAVAAAGGALSDADLDGLNLAATLTDGQQVYVPPREPAAPTVAASTGTGRSSSVSPQWLRSHPLNLNTATAAQLELLPGVGPVIAENIVSDRRANGPFRTVDDLTRVKGIGDKTLASLREFIRV